MHRPISALVALFVAVPALASAQELLVGPFAGLRAFGEAAEVAVLENASPISVVAPSGDSNLRVYDFDTVGGIDPVLVDSRSAEWGGDFQTDAVAADLDGDGAEESIFVKELGDGTVEMTVVGEASPGFEIRADRLLGDQAAPNPLRPMILDPVRWTDIRQYRVLQVVAGQLDADAPEEIAVAYWADDEAIEVVAFDDWDPMAGGFATEIRMAAGTPDAVILPDHPSTSAYHKSSAVLELAAVDFDGDGTDELALVWPGNPQHTSSVWDGTLDLSVFAVEEDAMDGPELVRRGNFPTFVTRPLSSGPHFLGRIEARGANLPPLRPAKVTGHPPEKLALVYRLIRRTVPFTASSRDRLITLTEVVELDRADVNTDFTLMDVASGRSHGERSVGSYRANGATAQPPNWAMCMDAGNIDGDSFDEIVVWDHGITHIFDFPPAGVSSPSDPVEPLEDPISQTTSGNLAVGVIELGETIPGTGSLRVASTRCDLGIVDLEGADDFSDFKPEMVLDFTTREQTESVVCTSLCRIYTQYNRRSRLVTLDFVFNGSGVVTGVANLGVASGEQIERTESALGEHIRVASFADLDGDRVHLAEPIVATQSIVQPLVYLSTPPIHFDVLDGQIIDPSGCYTDAQGNIDRFADCPNFGVLYSESSGGAMSFQTQFSSAWEVSASTTGTAGVEGPGVQAEVSATISASYGEDFTNSSTSTQTFEVTESRSATRSDQMLVSGVRYEIYEYPLMSGTTPLGHVAAIVTKATPPTWVSESSLTAIGIRPQHEPGNLLSYPDSFASEETSRALSLTSFELSPDTGSNVTLTFTTDTMLLQQQGVTASVGASATATASAEGGIGGVAKASASVSATVSGEYGVDLSETATVSVSSTQTIDLSAGSVGAIEKTYGITPIVRFDANGALRVDYSVDLAPGSFWASTYDEPDPALNLPRRFDFTKQRALTTDREFETKSIGFFPTIVAPGDPIRIFATVYNMSLVPTAPGVEVDFYFGDPQTNGQFIETLDMGASIAARENREGFVDWVIPADISMSGENRIFVEVRSPIGQAELRTENNLGWAALPGIAVPEPSVVQMAMAAISALAALRVRRRSKAAASV